ncbi:MAG: FAD/NAD(P)-binding protein, partial [Aeromicrobium sp.]
MDESRRKPRVVVVGAGAAGALTALHLTREASRRATPLEIVLLDPAGRWGRGAAFGTTEEQHLLNVPAAGMSALPQDPSHFVSWRRRHGQSADAYNFAPRPEFGRYLDETLTEAVRQSGGEASVEHRRTRAVSCRRSCEDARRVVVTTADGRDVVADAVVIAPGLPAAGHDWAPDPLRSSAFFVPDPWASGALDVVRRDHLGPGDVLLVGTGLTMVDVTLSLTDGTGRPDRVVRAISRSGRVPATHAPVLKPAAIPDIGDWGSTLEEIRTRAVEHVRGVERATGDWRPAVDGLRFQVAHLWGRLSAGDRVRFLAADAGRWNVVRHRMAPSSRVLLREL